MVPSTEITRRRALLLGAAAGLTTLVQRAPVPAWARGGGRAARATRGFGLDVPRAAFGDGRTSAVLRAPRRFDLLGVRGAPTHGTVVRVRRAGGSWSPWVPFGAGHDHVPDGFHRDGPSDPVWAGGADELQLRVARPLQRGMRVHFVTVARAARRRGAAASARAAARTAQAGPGSPPPIIMRADWGGDQVKPREPPSYGEVQVAFVHHTVSANDYQPEDSAAIVLAIAKYHRDQNGWNDLGYNFMVDKYGQIFEGRAGGIDGAVIGAQAQGYNRLSTGVSNIGTYSDIPQTDVGLEALSRVIGWKLSLHGVPVDGTVVVTSGGGSLNRYPSGRKITLNRICGHRDGDSTACPGNALYGQLPAIRTRAAKYATAVAVAERLTMVSSSSQVTYGDDLALNGTFVGADGIAVKGVSVSLQKRGTSGWVTVGKATTGDDGGWSAALPWKRAGLIRARAKAPGAAAAAISAAADVDLLPGLQARTFTRRVRAGQTLAVAGTLHPDGVVRVLIERQDTRTQRWRKVGVIKVKATKGAFRTRIRLRTAGLHRLTPSAAGTKKVVAAPALYVRAVKPKAKPKARRGASATQPPAASGGVGYSG